MKKILFIALAMLTLCSQMEVAAQKSDKETKGIKWNWDGKTLSGNAEIDNYIKTIDTLYNKVQSYVETMDKYELVTERFELNGKKYELAYMLDEHKQIVTRGTVNWQCVQALMQGTNIVLDMTNAGLMSANAVMTLPQLGLKALKFGKYVKGGPAVISAGTKAIKDVRKRWINNSRTWKDMKVDAIEDPKSIGYTDMTDELASKLNKCCYIKEVKEFSETKDESKSEGQVVSEASSVFNTIANAQQAAEDARKSNESMEGFDDLIKDAEKDA
jgi:hypothetical protein